jgi:pyrroloquinoline quinone biosynthesis protein D
VSHPLALLRPRLAPGTRVRWDRARGTCLLLGPEKGLLLNGTAAAVLRLCDGRRTLDELTNKLAGDFPEADAGRIAVEARELLADLAKRRYIALETG